MRMLAEKTTRHKLPRELVDMVEKFLIDGPMGPLRNSIVTDVTTTHLDQGCHSNSSDPANPQRQPWYLDKGKVNVLLYDTTKSFSYHTAQRMYNLSAVNSPRPSRYTPGVVIALLEDPAFRQVSTSAGLSLGKNLGTRWSQTRACVESLGWPKELENFYFQCNVNDEESVRNTCRKIVDITAWLKTQYARTERDELARDTKRKKKESKEDKEFAELVANLLLEIEYPETAKARAWREKTQGFLMKLKRQDIERYERVIGFMGYEEYEDIQWLAYEEPPTIRRVGLREW